MNKKAQHYLKKELYDLIKSDESIFDFIQEVSLDGLWYWDLENPEEEWMNPKFWKTLGYDPQEMPHKASAWQEIIYPEDLKLVIENAQKHWENPAHPYDQIVRYKHKNGSTVWIRCRGMAIHNKEGKAIRMLGAHNEVTREMETAAKWKRDNEMLRTILDKQSVYIVKTDLQGNYTYANDYFCQRLGVSREEVIGLSSIEHVIPQDRQIYREVLEKCIANKNIPHKVILQKQLPDQGYLTNECVISAFTYEKNEEPEELLCIGYDITKQKKNEQALRIAHQRLTSHLNNSPLGVIEYNRELIVTKWSKKCEEIFEWTQDEILNNDIAAFNLIYEDDLATTAKVAEDLMSGRVNGNISYNRNYTKSGKIVHCVRYNSTIKDELGNVISVMSLVQDVTQRKQHEQELIESRQKLANIVNNLPGFVYRCKNDKNWTMEFVSDACKEISGYGKDDLVDNKKIAFNDLIHPDDKERVWEEIQSALKEKLQYELSYRIRDKQRKEKWVWAKGMGVRDREGNIISLEGFVQDITEQKKAEREILLEKELSNNIINSLPGIFYLYNKKRQFLRWNKNFETVTGYSDEEIRHLHPIELFDEDEKELLSQKIGNVFIAGEDHVEANFLLKNKQKIPYYFTGVARIYNGETCLMGVGIDITDRVQAEKTLKNLLNVTTEQNKRLKEFSFITSHNIRSSVANLLGLIQVIKADPDNKDYIKMLQLTTEKLDKTIKNINALLNFENTLNIQDNVDCNLAEVIHRAIELNNQVIKDKKIEISVDIKESLTIKSIPAFLDSIFQNLISNAVKYGITQFSKKIEIFAEEKEGETTIYIKDYGLGMDLEKNKKKLFKLGSRFHNSSGDGQGIGLYMIKRQIEAIGGAINVESTINKGTIFKVCFYD